jgi:hypothetical protein
MQQDNKIALLLAEAKREILLEKQRKPLGATQSIPIKADTNASLEFNVNTDHIRLMSTSGIELSSSNSVFERSIGTGSEHDECQFTIDDTFMGLDDDQCEQQLNGQLQENLTNLQVEIDLKQRLVNELEVQKKNYDKMKHHYEEKLLLLHDRIGKIEDERDRVLSNITRLNQDNRYDDQIRKVKNDYEVKIKNLQYEIQKYSNLKQKHSQMVKMQIDNEKQLQQLANELLEMKKLKVCLFIRVIIIVVKQHQQQQQYKIDF